MKNIKTSIRTIGNRLTNKLINIKSLSVLIMVVVIGLSIGYSAFGKKLTITDTVVNVRKQADIRITGITPTSITRAETTGISNYAEYNVNSIDIGVTLPDLSSSVTYKVEVTNIGNVDMGIYSINNLPENLEYELNEYELKTKICNEENVCNLGITKEFYITIKYKENGYIENSTIYALNLDFEFKEMFDITYNGIDNSNNTYPTSIMSGETLSISFDENYYKVVPYVNDEKVNSYTYSNNKITVPNIEDPIEIKYKEKAYLTKLLEKTYFKESTYLTSIKTVQFVDYVDIPSDALATYNLEENNGTEIKGWIDKDYNLYIGSEWNIYAKDLSNAFYNMSGVTNIAFNNLNTSEATSVYYMFNGASSLTSLDVSTFNTSKVTNMGRMFQGLSKITSLDVSNFNTSSAITMYAMFYEMSSLTTLDLTHFDTSSVTIMAHMFQNMSSLTTLDISSFDTSKVTKLNHMFYGDSALTALDFRNATFTNVTEYSYVFTSISNNIYIITKDDTTKAWLRDKLGTDKGTIKTVAELTA